jgi:glycosyltransferase involved in cell wall biosynthesis
MHIVHTESTGELGGQSLRLIDEARGLKKTGDHRCTVVAPEGSPLLARAAQVADAVPFRFHRGSVHVLDLARAVLLLRRLGPDVVHTHSSSDAWTFGLAAKICGLPVVRGRHIAKPVPRSWFGRFAYTHLADAFTVSGSTIGRLLVDAGVADADRVFDTPASVDLSRFDPGRTEREAVRRELGIPAGARVIGSVSILRLMKGVDTLVDAHARLARRGHEDLWLVHAGGGGDSVLRDALARAGEHVRFLGFREDVERVLGAFDLFVLASRASEGVPQAILQAMALRIPVLATRAGGIPDVVREGETGFLVASDDAEVLADRIESLLAMPASELAPVLDRARRTIEESYTPERVVEKYLEAYRVVSNPGAWLRA